MSTAAGSVCVHAWAQAYRCTTPSLEQYSQYGLALSNTSVSGIHTRRRSKPCAAATLARSESLSGATAGANNCPLVWQTASLSWFLFNIRPLCLTASPLLHYLVQWLAWSELVGVHKAILWAAIGASCQVLLVLPQCSAGSQCTRPPPRLTSRGWRRRYSWTSEHHKRRGEGERLAYDGSVGGKRHAAGTDLGDA